MKLEEKMKNPPKPQVLVFDCDGVLREFSWLGIFFAYQAIAKSFSISAERLFPQNMSSFRDWLDHDWKNNLSRMGITSEDDVLRSQVIFHANYDCRALVFPWVNYVLSQLSENYSLAVFSNSTVASTQKSLQRSASQIRLFVGGDSVRNLKPHPEGLLMIAEYFAVSPEFLLMIGDHSVDIRAGKQAGAQTGVVAWGVTQDLLEIDTFQADFFFSNPTELLSI